MAFPADESWVVLSPIEASIKRKIEAVGTPLSEWDISINYGIKTGCNEAFIIPTSRRDEILAACRDEAERERTAALIRPILRGRDIKRYGYEWAELWIIGTHNGVRGKFPRIDIDDYPAVKAHLDQYWDKIAARDDQGATPYNLRNCAYWEDFEQPQILWIELSDEPKFCFAENVVSLNSIFFLTGKHLFHILGLLNSKLITWYFKHCIGTTSGVGTNRWLKYTIERLPIAGVDRRVEEFASQLCEEAAENRENIDGELGCIVCELYGLSPEEISFIEEQNHN